MELSELLADWDLGESEVRGVSWRRQYRDLVLRIHGVGDRKKYGRWRRDFKHEVNGELTFVGCARACFDRSLGHVDSDLEEWGSGAWTIVCIFEEKLYWRDRDDLTEQMLKHYAVTLDDKWPLDDAWPIAGGHRDWLHATCRDLTFNVLGPATDMQTPLRP